MIENVFYCPDCELAEVSAGGTAECAGCLEAMAIIGWSESDGDDKNFALGELPN
jgi:hypothetical protein